ncbi:phosphate propanoyltransferase [Clostridia bacterium]|nr:phosphate propanoyltransferase [Clostridia bacterium]
MGNLNVIVEASARHVHVTTDALSVLFGEGASLHNKRELSQPGQYITEEKVRIEGPRGAIDRVSILGPERSVCQVEVSLTDARALGISAPIRESGDIAGSSAITLVGPAGKVELAEGAIAAKRHVHLDPATANEYGIKDKDVVSLKLGGERGATLHEVVARVHPNFRPAVHLDIDEANGVALSGEVFGEIIK